MKYAIVESGGKQYKAVEGDTIEVDRLPDEAGKDVSLDAVLLMVDEDQITVGTPTVKGMSVKAKVLEHFKGEKVIFFRYRPKKRIRVKAGHRQQYTRLAIEQVGDRKAAKPAPASEAIPAEDTAAKKVEAKPAKKTEKKPAAKKPAPKKPAPKKATPAAKKSTTTSKTTKKSTTTSKTTKKS